MYPGSGTAVITGFLQTSEACLHRVAIEIQITHQISREFVLFQARLSRVLLLCSGQCTRREHQAKQDARGGQARAYEWEKFCGPGDLRRVLGKSIVVRRDPSLS